MDDDFDDSAVQMSITLGFDVADGDEPSSNLLVDTPEGIDRGKEDFCTIPFVHSLLRVPPRSVAITVGYCG